MKPSFLVTLYYALASIIGLVLTVIGASMLVYLIMTQYVLKIPRYPEMPPTPYEDGVASEVKRIEAKKLTDEDTAALTSWKMSYERWQKDQEHYNRQDVETKRSFASAASMLVIGIPVLLFHFSQLSRKKDGR